MFSLSLKGRVLKIIALTREKTVAFAPMPSASATMATALNPGFFARVRNPKRRSCHMNRPLQYEDTGSDEGGRVFVPGNRE
jgi:hypothetical protein